MAYYAPFYQTPTNYTPNVQNGFTGQNNGFYGYSNQQSNIPVQNVAQNQQTDGMIWVLGKNEAESYPVAPNCQVVLWDKNTPTLYVKSMSANNVPNLRILDFVERTETAQNAPKNDFNIEVDKFATKDDITALRGKINDLMARCDILEQLRNKNEEKAIANTSKTDKKSKGGNE